MIKKHMWLILTVISGVVLSLSICMSNKTGKSEYAWIIGSMLFGIGCGSRYHVSKKDGDKY